MKKKNIFQRWNFKYRAIRGLWTDSVALGVLFAFIFGLAEVLVPFSPGVVLEPVFYSLGRWGYFVLGIILLAFVFYAFWKPRFGGLGATFSLCGQRIIAASYPFNLIGVIFWVVLLAFAVASMINWYRTPAIKETTAEITDE